MGVAATAAAAAPRRVPREGQTVASAGAGGRGARCHGRPTPAGRAVATRPLAPSRPPSPVAPLVRWGRSWRARRRLTRPPLDVGCEPAAVSMRAAASPERRATGPPAQTTARRRRRRQHCWVRWVRACERIDADLTPAVACAPGRGKTVGSEAVHGVVCTAMSVNRSQRHCSRRGMTGHEKNCTPAPPRQRARKGRPHHGAGTSGGHRQPRRGRRASHRVDGGRVDAEVEDTRAVIRHPSRKRHARSNHFLVGEGEGGEERGDTRPCGAAAPLGGGRAARSRHGGVRPHRHGNVSARRRAAQLKRAVPRKRVGRLRVDAAERRSPHPPNHNPNGAERHGGACHTRAASAPRRVTFNAISASGPPASDPWSTAATSVQRGGSGPSATPRVCRATPAAFSVRGDAGPPHRRRQVPRRPDRRPRDGRLVDSVERRLDRGALGAAGRQPSSGDGAGWQSSGRPPQWARASAGGGGGTRRHRRRRGHWAASGRVRRQWAGPSAPLAAVAAARAWSCGTGVAAVTPCCSLVAAGHVRTASRNVLICGGCARMAPARGSQGDCEMGRPLRTGRTGTPSPSPPGGGVYCCDAGSWTGKRRLIRSCG